MKKALMVAHVEYAFEMFNMPNIRLLIDMGYEGQVAGNFDDRSSLSDEKVALLKNKHIFVCLILGLEASVYKSPNEFY